MIQNGYEPIYSNNQVLRVKEDISAGDHYFAEYLEYIAQPDYAMHQNSLPVSTAIKHFYSSLDKEKLMKDIEDNVLSNIFRNR